MGASPIAARQPRSARPRRPFPAGTAPRSAHSTGRRRCAHRVDRDAQECLDVLGKAVAAGYRNVTPLLHDPEFEPLRRRDDFQCSSGESGPPRRRNP